MGDNTPDRLKEFRSQYPVSQKGRNILGWIQLAVLAVGFATVIALQVLRNPAATATAPVAGHQSPEKQREFALYLESKNQPAAALRAYEEYVKDASLTPKEQSSISYSMAKLAADAERYEDALQYLYQAEFLDPASQYKDEIGKKIVFCLDKLGRNVDLRHELRKRTDVKRTAQDLKPDEVILAEFAGEIITNRDLENEIEKLPQTVRDSFSTPENKADLLKNMVAQRLLLDKARRMELDKDPAIIEQLGNDLDAMIVQKLITDEVRSGINVTPEDVERFYKAETDRFKEPASAEVIVAKADTEEAARGITEFKDKPVTVAKGRPIPGAPEGLKADAVFEVEPGSVTAPVQVDDAWYVIKVVSKKPERTPLFEEVKERAQRLFQMQKEQERINSLIEETLKARDVNLYLDRLQEAEKKS